MQGSLQIIHGAYSHLEIFFAVLYHIPIQIIKGLNLHEIIISGIHI
jgi:hypothetical protein